MSQKHYDYIIVGNGLAGLQLALAFAKDSYFNDKSIALIITHLDYMLNQTSTFRQNKPRKIFKISNFKLFKIDPNMDTNNF